MRLNLRIQVEKVNKGSPKGGPQTWGEDPKASPKIGRIKDEVSKRNNANHQREGFRKIRDIVKFFNPGPLVMEKYRYILMKMPKETQRLKF